MSEGDSSGEAGHPPAARHDLAVWASQEIIEIERRRIDRDNRRAAVAEKTLEMMNAADQRQFTYASETRDAKLTLQKDSQKFARRVTWVLVGLGSVVVSVLLGVLLFGDDAQRVAAASVVQPLLLFFAGYGLIAGSVRAFNRIFGR